MVAWLSEGDMKKVRDLAEEICQRESCRLYDIEWGGGGGGRILRVFAWGEGQGVDVDRCAEVSRGLNWLLDTQGLIPSGSYSLEVSSPGLERKLKELWHFQGAVNEKVKLTLIRPLEEGSGRVFGVTPSATSPIGKGRAAKQVKGILREAQEDRILLEVDSFCLEIFLDNIQKAQIVFEFKKASHSGFAKRKQGVRDGCR